MDARRRSRRRYPCRTFRPKCVLDGRGKNLLQVTNHRANRRGGRTSRGYCLTFVHAIGGATVTTATARAPFLDVTSFGVETVPEPPPVRVSAPARSPFLSVYELDDHEVTVADPLREAYALLVNELHVDEFVQSLFELQCLGRAMHD